MSVITSGKLAKSDPELVDNFAAAVDEVTAYAQEHPDEVRQTLTTFLDMKDDLAQKVLVEDFRAQMDQEALQKLAEMAKADGLLKKDLDMKTFMPAS